MSPSLLSSQGRYEPAVTSVGHRWVHRTTNKCSYLAFEAATKKSLLPQKLLANKVVFVAKNGEDKSQDGAETEGPGVAIEPDVISDSGVEGGVDEPNESTD
jgi:hypothetical protein